MPNRNPAPAILEYLPYRKRDGTYERDALTHAAGLEAETWPRYIHRMAETFKCPHCGALYEIITNEKTVSDDKNAAHCQVCGKQIEVTNGSSILRYELVKMPNGTNV
jgi:predicted RNA-binding Zn-ribbon protein involved in translation (DUF1610 family)